MSKAYKQLDHKEGWAPKNWCFWIVVLEKTLESPLHCKEIKPVNPKGNQPWIFIGGTDAEDEAPILWPCKDLTHWKRPWCWERLRAGGEGDDRGWDGWMASPTRWTWVWVDSGSWMDREAWHAVVRGVAKSWTRLSDWTELKSNEVKNTPKDIAHFIAEKWANFPNIVCTPQINNKMINNLIKY